MTPRAKSLSLMAVFTALVVVSGYALIHVPNVELVTATAFLAGAALGPKRGLLVGAVGEFFYAVVNPLGISAPPLLAAQVIGIAVAGYVGGSVARVESVRRFGRTQVLVFAACGLGLTLLFDLLTTLGIVVMTGQTLLGAFLYGVSFYATHSPVNTIIFALLVPVLFRVLVQTSLVQTEFVGVAGSEYSEE